MTDNDQLTNATLTAHITPERIAELLALDAITPTRWMVAEKLSDGSFCWFTVEHEHSARTTAAANRGAAVIPLYDAPAPDLHAALMRVSAENERLRDVMRRAHAVMRECGWQLAPMHQAVGGDGILELAVAEVEDEFNAILNGGNDDRG